MIKTRWHPLLAVHLVGPVSSASAADGLINLKSEKGAKAPMDRFDAAVKQRGLNVFARIEHAAATKSGKSLPPTELLIVGNPPGGTPFMASPQRIGIGQAFCCNGCATAN